MFFIEIMFFPQADTATQSPFDKAVADALGNIEAGVQKFQEVTGIKTEFDKVKLESFLKSGLGDSKKKIEEIIKSLESNVSGEFHKLHNQIPITTEKITNNHFKFS